MNPDLSDTVCEDLTVKQVSGHHLFGGLFFFLNNLFYWLDGCLNLVASVAAGPKQQKLNQS